MAFVLIDLPLDEVGIDEAQFPNGERDLFVYEHLRHYCSKFDPLPVIMVRLFENSTLVIRGHQYVMIARDLGRKSIRALVDKDSPNILVQRLLNNPSVVELEWDALRKEEQNTLFAYCWYIFFFERPLNQKERLLFENQIVSFLKNIEFPESVQQPAERVKNLNYQEGGKCVELQAFVPIADERWYASFRTIMLKFHSESVRIVSFQGRKFVV